MIDIGIVTPVYPPSPGGGATYTKLLSEYLVKEESVAQVSIYTERYPGREQDCRPRSSEIKLREVFSYRSGKSTKDLTVFFKYLYQQFQFVFMFLWLSRKHSAVLIHSSFHVRPNLVWLGVALHRALVGDKVKFILDIRDPKIGENKAWQFYFYSKLICCSSNVFNKYSSMDVLRSKCVEIPIIFDVDFILPEDGEVESVKHKYGITEKSYIFNSNGILGEKRVFELVRLVRLIRALRPGVVLVVAGKNRDWNKELDDAVSEGVLKYVGIVSHKEVLALSKGAMAHVNIALFESLGRGSVEAILMGTPAFVPCNVPEFRKFCSNFVLGEESLEVSAEQILKVVDARTKQEYPVERHSPKFVIPMYLNVFQHKVA